MQVLEATTALVSLAEPRLPRALRTALCTLQTERVYTKRCCKQLSSEMSKSIIESNIELL